MVIWSDIISHPLLVNQQCVYFFSNRTNSHVPTQYSLLFIPLSMTINPLLVIPLVESHLFIFIVICFNVVSIKQLTLINRFNMWIIRVCTILFYTRRTVYIRSIDISFDFSRSLFNYFKQFSTSLSHGKFILSQYNNS